VDADPGLIDRIRWGNVGRLAALLAAGMLVATGPHGCAARGGQAPASLPAALKAAPTPTASMKATKPTVVPHPKAPRRYKRRRKRVVSRKRPVLHPYTGVKAGRLPPKAAPPPVAGGEFAP
jgi:hypothetical protein